MKSFLIGIICSVLLSTSVFAEGNTSGNTWYKDVEYYDFELSLEKNDGGSVEIEWNEFEKDKEFLWYKLLHSTTNKSPVYPDQAAAFVGSNVKDNSNSLWLESWKTHYIRVCAITQEGDSIGRYCGKTQKFYLSATNSENTKKKAEGIKAHYEKKTTEIEEYEAQKTQKETRTKLSSALKARIDSLLKNFIQRLEAKDISDTERIEAIDAVIGKLVKYIDDEKYTAIVTYMIETLETYKSKYGNLDIFEDILNDF